MIHNEFGAHFKLQNDVQNGSYNDPKDNITENWSVDCFISLFDVFPDGADPRSSRAGAIETQLLISGVISNIVLFLFQLRERFYQKAFQF